MAYDTEPAGGPDNLRQDHLAARLLRARTIMINGPVDQELAERVMSELFILDTESNDPIRVVITSQGGHVDSGLAIYDVMRFIRAEIIAIAAGWCASIAVPLMFGAEKKNRVALPNTRFLIHQPSGGAGGQLADIRIQAQEIVKLRERLNQLISKETGQDIDRVRKDSDRDYWMTAEGAVEYGIIDRIVQKLDEIPA